MATKTEELAALKVTRESLTEGLARLNEAVAKLEATMAEKRGEERVQEIVFRGKVGERRYSSSWRMDVRDIEREGTSGITFCNIDAISLGLPALEGQEVTLIIRPADWRPEGVVVEVNQPPSAAYVQITYPSGMCSSLLRVEFEASFGPLPTLPCRLLLPHAIELPPEKKLVRYYHWIGTGNGSICGKCGRNMFGMGEDCDAVHSNKTITWQQHLDGASLYEEVRA